MIRTIISLDADEKKWLSKVAENKKISMAEVIREAIRCYHNQHADITQPDFEVLLKKTSGIWHKKTDGLKYIKKIREEWD